MAENSLITEKCSESRFNILKSELRESVYIRSTKSTSFFIKKKTPNLLKYFSADITLLSNFLKAEYVIDGFNQAFFTKIDTLVLEIIESNPAAFIKDKKFGIYAKRFYFLQSAKYDPAFLCFNNSLIKISKKRFEFFTDAQTYEIENVFSDENIKKTSAESKTYFFEKDILNSLVRYIRSGQGTIDDITTEDLLINPDKTNSYVEILNEIVEKKLYLRKRKNKGYKTLNKISAKEIFCDYLRDWHQVDFKDYCKNNEINVWSIRNDDFYKYAEHAYAYVNLDKLAHSEAFINQLANNSFGVRYYYNSSEYLLEALALKKKFDVSKKLNPKKYSFKTKKIINEHKREIALLVDRNSSFYPLLLEMIDSFMQKNVSEKAIRPILFKLLNVQKIFISKEIINYKGEKDLFYYLPSSRLEHWVHDLRNILKKYIEMGQTDNVLMLRSYLTLCNSFNYDTPDKIHTLNTHLNLFAANLKSLSLKEDRVFKNFNEFNTLLSEIEELELQAELRKAKELYSKESLSMSKNMKSFKMYLNLLNHLPKSFKEVPISHEASLFNDETVVEILNHQNPIGLLGAFVGGVCIDGAGDHRKDQLNPNFMNLIIRNDKRIHLWGLLCKGTFEGKKIYVLNNLQGSVNKEVKNDVLELIKEALKQFKRENEAEYVFFKKLSFNALNLTGEDVGKIRISLNKKIRLDFAEEDVFFAL